MPKKTIQIPVQIPEQETPPQQEKQLSPTEKRRIIEQSPAVHQATLALIRGRTFATTRFPHYGGFLCKLRLAYQDDNRSDFLYYLREYLKEGNRYVSQIPDAQKAEKILADISALVTTYGTRAVASCVLARLLG